MQTKCINVYSINELSDKAKERAYDEYLSNGDYYHWDSENRDSLDKFAEVFNLKIKSASYGDWSEGVTWEPLFYDYQDEILALSGIRLLRWLYNNVMPQITKGKYYSTKGTYDSAGKYHYKKRYSKCQFEIDNCPLTGYCMDLSILDPVYKFLKNPSEKINLSDLIDNCFDSWITACNEDLQHAASMEAFIETCEANDWTFTESGKMENI